MSVELYGYAVLNSYKKYSTTTLSAEDLAKKAVSYDSSKLLKKLPL